MKNIIRTLGAAVILLVAFVTTAPSQNSGSYYGFQQGAVIDSTLTTYTVVSNGYWPTSIPTNATRTNVTIFASPNSLNLALQFSGKRISDYSTNVIIKIARSVQGGAATNAAGTGLKYEDYATWTIPLSVTNSAGITTACTNFGTANGSKGAIGNFYITTIACDGDGVTNYQVYAHSQ